MLKKVENVCYWQVLRMIDEDGNSVSVANTEDNWRETAVCINWGSTETDKWYIKMWNWKEKIEVAKTITDALEILYWIDADMIWSGIARSSKIWFLSERKKEKP